MNLIEYYLELDLILRDYSSKVLSTDGCNWTLTNYSKNEIPSSYSQIKDEYYLLELLYEDGVIPNSMLKTYVKRILALNSKTNSTVPKLTEEQAFDMLKRMSRDKYQFALPSSWC